MWIVSIIAAGVIALCLWFMRMDKRRAYVRQCIPFGLTPREIECAIMQLQGQPTERRYSVDGALTLTYRCGDLRVVEAHKATDDMWTEWMPFELVVTAKLFDNISLVGLHMLVPSQVTLSMEVIKSFKQFAATELASLVAVLERAEAEWAREPRSKAPHQEPQSAAPATSADDSDFGLLGLKPGATWPEVQAAFRTISMQFHPDRMVGLPPHLVELGTKRFNEASAAYQRLRGQFGSQA